jgi:hypothetical protein
VPLICFNGTFIFMIYQRTKILKHFIALLKTSKVDYKIQQNHAVIFPIEYTLFFCVEDRVIFHNRNTQERQEFKIFSITQLVIICSFYGVYQASQKHLLKIDIFKWLYALLHYHHLK